MGYEVRQGFFGDPTVAYTCTACGSPLESPLAEAGTSHPCPICQAAVVTPGEKELEQQKDEELRKAVAEANARVAALGVQREEETLRAVRQEQAAPPDLVWYGAMVCHDCGYRWQARRNTPPAKCASCSRRNISAVREPRHAAGCFTSIVLAVGIVAVLWRTLA